MTFWEAGGWMVVVILGAVVITAVAVIWDAWMERRGWRGWKRP